MNIVYIAPSIIPSASANSVHIMKMCEAFAQNNVSVKLLVPSTTNNLGLGGEYEFYGVCNNFKIIRNKFVTNAPVGIWNYIFAFSSILYAIYTKSDVIFTRNPIVSFFCIIFRKRHILEMHDEMRSVSFKLFKLFKLFKSKMILKFLVISKPLKGLYLKEFDIEPNKVLVLPDGVNYEQFIKINVKKPLQNEVVGIGYIGSLYKGRGIDVILNLAKNIPSCKFKIYGGSPEEASLVKTHIDKKNIKNIFIHQHIPNKEVPEKLCEQDILLMPYQRKVQERGGGDTAKWMSPMKMFEYMASGRVIVSSDLPVIREVLNENNSYLVDPENIQEWINVIKEIINNKDMAIDKADKAKEDVLQYTWHDRAKQIIRSIDV